jgi:peptide/nickel transport system permease protein
MIMFCMFEFLPGNFAQAILGQAATPEIAENFNKRAGLDKPLSVRYGKWLWGAVKGDFGFSYSSLAASPAGTHRRLHSLSSTGEHAFPRSGRRCDCCAPGGDHWAFGGALSKHFVCRAVNATTLTSISFPEFFVGYILMLFLAVKNPWFYFTSMVESTTTFWEHLSRIGLPVICLVLVIVAHMMRMTRAAIINLLARPFIEMAQLKGMPPIRVIWHHALPNAWAPVATVVALNLAYLVVGVLAVEVVFAYPGIGRLMVDAVQSRDVPVVQACAIIFATVYVALNLLADIIGIVTNPRLLHPR